MELIFKLLLIIIASNFTCKLCCPMVTKYLSCSRITGNIGINVLLYPIHKWSNRNMSSADIAQDFYNDIENALPKLKKNKLYNIKTHGYIAWRLKKHPNIIIESCECVGTINLKFVELLIGKNNQAAKKHKKYLIKFSVI